jgi:hypothetical protein
MKLLNSAVALAALMCTSSIALADQGMGSGDGQHRGQGQQAMMYSQMKSMDTNADGLITKEEFMKAHEAMWEKMPKNSTGAVSIADMEKAHQERRNERRSQRHETMMQQHEKMMREHEETMHGEDAASDDDAKKDPAN